MGFMANQLPTFKRGMKAVVNLTVGRIRAAYLLFGLLVAFFATPLFVAPPFSVYTLLVSAGTLVSPMHLSDTIFAFIYQLLPFALLSGFIYWFLYMLSEKRYRAAALCMLIISSQLVINGINYALNPTITINDYGSTNSSAFTITVRPDGSGSTLGDDSLNDLAPNHVYPTSRLDYWSLKQALDNLKPSAFKNNHCTKSASFGSYETITYQRKVIGDISCPYDMPEQSVYNVAYSIILATGK